MGETGFVWRLGADFILVEKALELLAVFAEGGVHGIVSFGLMEVADGLKVGRVNGVLEEFHG